MSFVRSAPPLTRWDQWVLRLVVVVAIGVTVAASVPPAHPMVLWRALVGIGLAVVLAVAVIGGGMRRHAELYQQHAVTAAVLAVASGLVPVVLTNGALVWLPYLGMMAAAGSGLGLIGSVAVAAVPFVGLAARTWVTTGDLATLGVNVGAALVAFAWVMGRNRQREADELAVAQAEVIRQERLSIEAAERQRVVAAQVHDVLAHTLSGLIITLQGSVVQAEQEHASAALVARLRTASDLARGGLDDARQAVATLTQPGAATEPWPDWLARTVARLADGADVEIRTDGAPESVPAEWVDLARSTVREGLTNSVRHAAGTPVALAFGPDAVTVTSVGDPTTFVDRGHRGSGRGLLGLQQRAADRGGTVTWGPTPDGFVLRLTWSGSR